MLQRRWSSTRSRSPRPIELWDDPAARRRRARERRLAHDLVELSRLDRGLERAEPAPVDLARLLRAVTADYAGPLLDGPSAARIEDRFAPPCARALRFCSTTPSSTACLRSRCATTSTPSACATTGPGFPANVLARAAEPFVTGRGDGARRRPGFGDCAPPGGAAGRRAAHRERRARRSDRRGALRRRHPNRRIASGRALQSQSAAPTFSERIRVCVVPIRSKCRVRHRRRRRARLPAPGLHVDVPRARPDHGRRDLVPPVQHRAELLRDTPRALLRGVVRQLGMCRAARPDRLARSASASRRSCSSSTPA